jgi:hypothetical protein
MTTTPAADVPSKPAVRKTAVTIQAATLSPAKAGTTARATGRAGARAWTGEDRYRMIAEVAYFRAERRGFAPGSELGDWLAAEIEVDDILGEAGPR